MDGYASRKFILACSVAIIGTLIFVFTNKLTSVEWLTLVGVNGGGYGILNLVDRYLNKNGGSTDANKIN